MTDFLLIVDFNSEPLYETMSDFMELYDLKTIVRVPMGYKNLENPSCIDFFLYKQKSLFPGY